MGQVIHVKAGSTFEVPLEGSAGTGFRWELVSSAATKHAVTLVDEDREATSTVPGGRTIQHFRFSAQSPGKAGSDLSLSPIVGSARFGHGPDDRGADRSGGLIEAKLRRRGGDVLIGLRSVTLCRGRRGAK